MAPNVTSAPTGVLFEGEEKTGKSVEETPKEEVKYERRIVWRNVVIFLYLHLAAVYGLYLTFTSAKVATILLAIFLYHLGGIGITAGAHRLWSHKAYKAKWPLQLILVIFNTLAFQDSVIFWSLNHRVHHKYSETSADPHNAKRGFFFSHMGWLFVRKHPDVIAKGKGIDMSDLENNPILAFQHKYYRYLMPLICFVLPSILPHYLWNETLVNSYFVCAILRYVLTLHMTWLVNSAAHMYGNRPYDRFMNPAENRGVAILAFGEGWHNYHHTFPWDYKAAELGNYRLNLTTAYIDFFAKIGWAYDLKSVSESMVKSRVLKSGDGTHEVWGWGDKDQKPEDIDRTILHYPQTKDQ